MTRNELLMMGIDLETAKQIIQVHSRDMAKLERKLKSGRLDSAPHMREAIISMLPVLKDKEHLQHVLKDVTYFYHKEVKLSKEAKKMAYYTECPHCGAKLDPGEKCDCSKNETKTKQDKEETTND